MASTRRQAISNIDAISRNTFSIYIVNYTCRSSTMENGGEVSMARSRRTPGGGQATRTKGVVCGLKWVYVHSKTFEEQTHESLSDEGYASVTYREAWLQQHNHEFE